MTGFPSTCWPDAGSYEAQSPTTGERIRFDDDEIEAEVARVIEENQAAGFPAVQAVAEMAPLFVHPDRLITEQAHRWTERYNLWKRLQVQLAPTLDEVDARFADAVQVIERETQNALKFKQQG